MDESDALALAMWANAWPRPDGHALRIARPRAMRCPIFQLDAFTTRRFGDGYLDGEIELI